jgi:predicted DNA-binding transcriptional regulator AlpA
VFTANKIASDGYLPARAVWERYGITTMTLYRWIASETLGFPPPVYLGRFRYWKIADLLAWEAGRSDKAERGYNAGRRLTPAEVAAVAAEIGLSVAPPETFNLGGGR